MLSKEVMIYGHILALGTYIKRELVLQLLVVQAVDCNIFFTACQKKSCTAECVAECVQAAGSSLFLRPYFFSSYISRIMSDA